MNTNKLYLDQPNLKQFTATILRTFPHGSHHAVILDQTAFYPTSGGQMHDTGTINGIEVMDVIEQDDEILHLVKSPLEIGRAKCKINWQRRFDFMQQHTGFHILARSFFNVTGQRTLSSHLGEGISTIDVNLADIDLDQIVTVENLANQIIFENRSVKSYFRNPDEIDPALLRKDVPEREQMRIIEIEGFDVDPCGGTHVSSTGQVGLVKIIRWDKIRGYVRFEFFAGSRAIRDYQKKWSISARLSHILSTSEDEFVASIEKLQSEMKLLNKKNRTLTEQNITYEAHDLIRQAERKGQRIIVRLFENREPQEIRYLAKQITESSEYWAFLGLKSENALLFFARPEKHNYNLNELVKQVAHLIEGKGGGRPNFVEAGGTRSSALDEALQSARLIIENTILK